MQTLLQSPIEAVVVPGGPSVRRLQDLSLRGEGHAFDQKTGRSYTLNGTALAMLELLREGQEAAEVIATLARRCGQHPAVVEAGYRHFVGQLTRYLP